MYEVSIRSTLIVSATVCSCTSCIYCACLFCMLNTHIVCFPSLGCALTAYVTLTAALEHVSYFYPTVLITKIDNCIIHIGIDATIGEYKRMLN